MEVQEILSSVLYTLLYVLLFWFMATKRKSIETMLGLQGDTRQVADQTLKPIPSISPAYVVFWLLYYGDCRPVYVMKWVRGKEKILQGSFGNLRVVAINDLELGKQMFRNPVFCGRTTPEEGISFYAPGLYGVISNFGQQWKDQRRFCHQHLKQFGFGTKFMESLIQKEVDDLIENWAEKKGKLFSPNKAFYLPLLSSIWSILVGRRANQDQQLIRLVSRVYEGFRNAFRFPDFVLVGCKMKISTVSAIINWTPFFPGLKLFQKSAFEFRDYCQMVIDARKELLDENTVPNNLVDAYLLEIKKTTDVDSTFFGKQGELNLSGAMFDFFVGGGDTTANMLAWAMLHLIRNPDIQERIRKEVDVIVGADRKPCLADRASCPFTEAFMWEVLRFNPIAASSLPHTATESTNIGPYFIDKGTMILLNIYGIQHDPDIWGDPEVFRPERFLSEDGQTVIKSDAVCVFSLGLRKCLGEQVARDNLFLFITAICQRFILKYDPALKHPPPVHDEKSIIHAAKKFYMIAIDRWET